MEESPKKIKLIPPQFFQAKLSPVKTTPQKIADKTEILTAYGYIHELTATLTSKRSGARYLNFLLQTAPEKYTRVVSFAPDSHRDILSRSAGKELSLEFSNVKYTESRQQFGEQDIKINSGTKIKPVMADFQCAAPPLLFTDLEAVEGLRDGARINVHGKIQKQSECEEINGVNKQDNFLMDQTASIRLAAWDTLIDIFQLDHYYSIEKATVRTWQDSKYLSTSVDTIVKNVDAFEIPDGISLPEDNMSQDITVSVVSIVLSKHLQCEKCNHLLDCPPEEKATKDTFVRCQCGSMQRKKHMDIIFRGSAELVSRDQKLSAVFTKAALMNTVNVLDPTRYGYQLEVPTDISAEQLQTVFLLEEEFSVKIDMSAKIIHSVTFTNLAANATDDNK